MLRKTCDSSFLLHALVDSVVDRYFKVVEFYEEQLSALENFVILKPRVSLTRTLHIVGKELSLLRKTISPTEQLLQNLSIDF
jgi:Mg2+ and Co2+ transporter CorA